MMRNITVTVDDETYRRARIRAAELDTSVSAEVKRFLKDFAGEDTEFQRLQQLERDTRARIKAFSAGDRLSRDELYDRAARRSDG